MIKLFKDYFQKSKVFLYPILGIAKGARYIPEETYMSWANETDSNFEDMKLFCVYKTQGGSAYAAFEDRKLLKNKLFIDCKSLDNDLQVYIFDFSDFPQTWLAVKDGIYSKIHEREKQTILSFFGEHGIISDTIESYMYPDYYHEDYASQLNVSDDLIKNVWEVCDKPDLNKETLKIINGKNHLIIEKSISLPNNL